MCMKNKHIKSPCCKSIIRNFGGRRRQCSKCKCTWRIRQKKRGRKPHRPNKSFILAYFQKRFPPLRVLAIQRGVGKDAVHLLLKKSLELYVRKTKDQWIKDVPANVNLIAIADAIWYHVKKEFYTIYVILLRPQKGREAIICPPVIIRGREDLEGWEKAFASLPQSIKSRICAFVCDGATSLVALARLHGWILQRCHFHLLAAIQNYVTTGPRSVNRPFAMFVLRTVQTMLATNDLKKIRSISRTIIAIRKQSSSRGLRRVLSGFLKTYRDYHSYLNYPELCLPTTSNAAESCIQCFRDFMYRCRGFRSYSALNKWLTALAFFKKTIRCNGKNQPN